MFNSSYKNINEKKEIKNMNNKYRNRNSQGENVKKKTKKNWKIFHLSHFLWVVSCADLLEKLNDSLLVIYYFKSCLMYGNESELNI